MNKFTIYMSKMLKYIFSSLVCIHLVLLHYYSAEDCRYQLILPGSCYIDNGSLSDVSLPCTLETCSNADYACAYNGTGQDFSFLVFYCNSIKANSERLNCTFRRTSWILYNNITALFNVCLINEATCNIPKQYLANCALNSFSTNTTHASTSASTAISVVTTSKITTSLATSPPTPSPLSTSTTRATTTEWVKTTSLESAKTTPNIFSASPTKNASQSVSQSDISTISVSSHSDTQETNENNNLIIGLPVAFGIVFLILTLVFIIAFVHDKRKKSRSRKKTNALNTQLNLRSSQTSILAITDADSQGYTVDYANHQVEKKTQNDGLSVYTNENSLSSSYSRVIGTPKDLTLSKTKTHSEPLLVQYSLVKKTHNNVGNAGHPSVQPGYTSNNLYGNSGSKLLTENDTTYHEKKTEVQKQSQEVNYSKLFEVSRESTSEYAEVFKVNQSVHL
uniref:Uncharacterized protein n=1 Tax=Biomphalaria glabrata TaxID=6526 RepID=A0A2C9M8L8_BIOGL